MRLPNQSKEFYRVDDPFWIAVEARATRNRALWQSIFYSTSIDGYSPQHVHDYCVAVRKHFRCALWQTKEGHVIPLIMMRDSHLVNALSYHNRIIVRLHGEATIESVFNDLIEARQCYDHMVMLDAEMNRRKLPHDKSMMDNLYYLIVEGGFTESVLYDDWRRDMMESGDWED